MATTSIENTQIKPGTVTDTQIATANKDGLAAVASMRTLGTGSQQAASGNDSRLATPTSTDGSLTVSGVDTIISPGWINGYSLINGYVSQSVASNALTISIKNSAGNTPSSSDPVKVVFLSSLSGGGYTVLTITSATTLVISSGSTMGFISSTIHRLWVVGFNDGGTFRLGAINCLSGSNIYPLRSDIFSSSTAEGGAGGADSAHVIYTGTAVSNKEMKVLGYLEFASPTINSGLWALAFYNRVYGPGVVLPGEVIQRFTSIDGSVATGTTQTINNDTIPQNTQGDQYMSQAITPTSAANVLAIDGMFCGSHSVALTTNASLFQDSVANALQGVWTRSDAVATPAALAQIHYRMKAGTTVSTTFKIRLGAAAAGTYTFNGFGGARKLGGVMGSMLDVTEYMA